MGDLTCLKQGPGITDHHVGQMVGRTWQQSSLSGGGKLPVIGEIFISYWLTVNKSKAFHFSNSHLKLAHHMLQWVIFPLSEIFEFKWLYHFGIFVFLRTEE